jgi:hypothetical protein
MSQQRLFSFQGEVRSCPYVSHRIFKRCDFFYSEASANCAFVPSQRKPHMTPVVTQVLVKKKKQQRLARPIGTKEDSSNEQQLYYKDVAGFFIFLLVVFIVLMISLYA